MFGFFKWKRSVNDAFHYCSTMFAGLEIYGRPVPNAAFGDAYVIGFLQQLIVHAVSANEGRIADPRTVLLAAEATFDRLVPGLGPQLTPALQAVNEPTHPAHANYLVGRREGAEYIRALLEGDDATMLSHVQSFRQFVKRNYLST